MSTATWAEAVSPLTWALVTAEVVIVAGSGLHAFVRSDAWARRWLLWHLLVVAAVLVAVAGSVRVGLDVGGRACARRAVERYEATQGLLSLGELDEPTEPRPPRSQPAQIRRNLRIVNSWSPSSGTSWS